MPGAKIIHRDPASQRAQTIERARAGAKVNYGHRFRDLKNKLARKGFSSH